MILLRDFSQRNVVIATDAQQGAARLRAKRGKRRQSHGSEQAEHGGTCVCAWRLQEIQQRDRHGQRQADFVVAADERVRSDREPDSRRQSSTVKMPPLTP